MADNLNVRSGNTKSRTGRQAQDRFHREFDTQYAQPLCQTMINIINRKKTQFVGNKTLNCSLRFVTKAIRNKPLYYSVCQPHLQSILFEITLPLMLITDKEVQTWSENQVEFVRQQVDYTNNWNVKRTNEDLIKAICNIRPTRKVKISNYLTGFLNIIVESMTNQSD